MSAHWYTPENFTQLIASYIGHDQDRGTDRYVRDIFENFRGLSATKKQAVVMEKAEMPGKGKLLSSLANDKDMDHTACAKLLTAMKANCNEVPPSKLGVIGKAHLLQRFIESGCDENTFDYVKDTGTEDGVPSVVETAFAMMKEDDVERRVVTGVNWSGAIDNPFRSLGGGNSWGDGVSTLLEKQMAGSDKPVMFLMHVACARVRYTDHGKTTVAIS